MSEIKIPNCPCCDGESKLHDYGGGDFRDSEKQFFIKCEKCGLTTRHSASKDEVLMTWGKRKPMERIRRRMLAESLGGIMCQPFITLKKALSIVEKEGGINA